MNKERILALADLIEKQPHTDTRASSGFTMSAYTHSCGTPACMAGWAVHDAGEDVSAIDDDFNYAIHDRAAELLGLSCQEADDLFVGKGFSLSRITPAQAAACLRHLAETGEVDWDHAMGVAA